MSDCYCPKVEASEVINGIHNACGGACTLPVKKPKKAKEVANGH